MRAPGPPSERVRSRLIVFLCLTVWSTTFPIGAFPALIPDLDRVVRLSTLELGALTAAFGFARMVVDIPVGLFVARHLRWALVLAPVLLAAGVLAIGSGGPFPVLLLGRALMGVAHALGMVAWLTTILRHSSGALGTALNAFELSAMLGMLGGAAALSALPRALPWNLALLVACAPQVVAVVVSPVVVASLPAGTGAASASSDGAAASPVGTSRVTPLVVLAFAAGTAVAIAYSTMELFMIPLRGSREFGLDRAGVARLLMLAQLSDIAALLPAGFLADRAGPARVLGVVLFTVAAASLLVGFGDLGGIAAGAALFGLGMAGWMLPLAVLRRETPPAQIAWRTALYRVGVDGGLFLGPLLSGLLGDRAGILPVTFAAVLLVLGAIFLTAVPPRR